jgi:predicted AAA+ superfamily ATPase
MSVEDLRKGKGAEYFVFSELIRKGADLYLPVIDTGIDAILRKKDGTYLEIQVKSTEKEDQAGYFNVDDINEHPEENYFIICVDFNEEKSLEKGKPNIWILPAKDFKEYMVSGCRLPIYERSHKHNNKVRFELLKSHFYDWKLLTG